MTFAEPSEVAELLERLMTSDWPTSELERVHWFGRHGLEAEGAEVDMGEHELPGRRVYGPASQNADSPGWHTFRNEFVGLVWFLWSGKDGWVRQLATELRTELDSRLVSLDSEDDPDGGFNARWIRDECRIDCYLHATRDFGALGTSPAVVQLHLDHAERADALEAEARRVAVLRSRPFKR